MSGVRPAAERGFIYAEEFASLAKRYPASGKAFRIIAMATVHWRTSLNYAKRLNGASFTKILGTKNVPVNAKGVTIVTESTQTLIFLDL